MAKATRSARADGLRDDALLAALDAAVAGRPDALYQSLTLSSRLPGPRPNLDLAEGIALELASRGKAGDRLLEAMITIDASRAPGGTPWEFIPMVGVVAAGVRGAGDEKARARVVDLLHDAAADLRYRVRGLVPEALARIGEVAGDALVPMCTSWTEGYFHAAALLLALAHERWVKTLADEAEVLARLDEAFVLAETAPRSAERYPGRKALVEALGTAPASLTARFGPPVLDLLARHTKTKMPELRDAIRAVTTSKALAARYRDALASLTAALAATETAPRDPTRIVQGTRGRGGKRRR